MKNKVLIILASISLSSCSSQGKKEDIMNVEKRISFIESKIKKNNYEPLYQINVETMNCFEVLINGFPV